MKARKLPPTSQLPLDDLNSRQRLLQIAAKLFAQKGFTGVSTRDIAREAEVNISLISYYFQGKEGLYLAVLQDFFGQARARMQEMFADFSVENMTRETFLQQMSWVIRGMLEMKFQTPHVPRLLFRELLEGLPNAHEFVKELFETMAMRLITMFEIAQKKGIVRPDLHMPTHFMTLVHATDTYFILSQCESPTRNVVLKLPEQKDQYCDQIIKVFIEGVLK